MKLSKLSAAIDEAERFISKAKALRDAHSLEWSRRSGARGNHEYLTLTPKEQGATRRSSMELTRALADLRSRDY